MHTLVRRFLPGWKIRAESIEFFRAETVAIERYRYRGTRSRHHGQAPPRRHEHAESRMRWKPHVRFGRRAAETDRSRDRRRAAARPHTSCRTFAGWVSAAFVIGVFSRRVVGWQRPARCAPTSRSTRWRWACSALKRELTAVPTDGGSRTGDPPGPPASAARDGADDDHVTTIDETTGRGWRHLTVKAEEEAKRFPLKPEREDRVAAAIEAARRQLGGDNVEGHTVLFNPEKWQHLRDALPPRCVATGKVSRGDVFTVAGRGRSEDTLWQLFVASYVWGQGKNGYGPARLNKIVRVTGQDDLAALIGEALKAGDQHGPMAAYDQLRGDHRYRGAAPHWGAAFFTKALYFGLRSDDATQSPLILDRVMARRVTQLSDMPHLLYQGFGYNWSFHRYGVYLAWMGQTAERFEVSPELLEYSLFKADLSN